jgi:hypothetical protein
MLARLLRRRRRPVGPPPTVEDAAEGLRVHLRGAVDLYEDAKVNRKVTALWVADCGLTIKETAAIVGIHENTLRAWQREAQALKRDRERGS